MHQIITFVHLFRPCTPPPPKENDYSCIITYMLWFSGMWNAFCPLSLCPSRLTTWVSYKRVITQAGNHLALSVISLNARQGCKKKQQEKKGNPAGLFSPSCLVWGLSLIMRMRSGGHYCGGISVSVWQKGATQPTKLAPNLWVPGSRWRRRKRGSGPSSRPWGAACVGSTLSDHSLE